MDRKDSLRPSLNPRNPYSRSRRQLHPLPVEIDAGPGALPFAQLLPGHGAMVPPGHVPHYPNEASPPIVSTAQVGQIPLYNHPVYPTYSNALLYPAYQHPPQVMAGPPPHRSLPPSSAEVLYVDRVLTPRPTPGDLDSYHAHPQYAYHEQSREADADAPTRTDGRFGGSPDQPYLMCPLPGGQFLDNAGHTLTTPVKITVADIVNQLLYRVTIEEKLRTRWTGPDGILFRWAHYIDTRLWKYYQIEEPPVEKGDAKELVKYVSKKGMKGFSRFDIFIDRRSADLFHCLWVLESGRCGHTAKRRGSMRAHIRGHFGYAPYACKGTCIDPHCNERFACKELLSKHRAPKTKDCHRCLNPITTSNFSRHVQSCTG